MGKRIGNFNLVNYKDHPTNDLYKIINYNSIAEADLFEEKMKAAGLFFEMDTAIHNTDKLYLFAVKNRDFEAVQKINFEVYGTFRSPMIKNKLVRFSLVIFFILMLTLAAIGYLKSNS